VGVKKKMATRNGGFLEHFQLLYFTFAIEKSFLVPSIRGQRIQVEL
jgi:hypothetical protein